MDILSKNLPSAVNYGPQPYISGSLLQVRKPTLTTAVQLQYYMCVCIYLYIFVEPSGQTKNDTHLKYGTHTPIRPYLK